MAPESRALFDPVDVDLAIDQLILEDDCAPAVPRTSPTPRLVRYDRAFEPAVRAGYLTVPEAVQRGDREAYGARLESRFDLPHDLAIRVTDGRMRLTAAIEECERRQAAADVGRAVRWPRVAAALVLILLGSGFFGAARLATQRQIARKLENAAIVAPRSVVEAGETATAPREETPPGRVERDADGWVTRITAGHPADALFTFCTAATPAAGCASLDVVELEPRFPGRRLGHFTLDADGRTWVILIRRENGSGRWAIGTGLRPISPTSQASLDEVDSTVWPYVPEFVPAEETPAQTS